MKIVYLHAIGLDQFLWDGIALAGATAVELPGHGDEPYLDHPVSFDSLVDFLAAKIREPVHLVGVSLGSMLAQHFAIRSPELLRSLVLACAGPSAPADVMRKRAAETRSNGMAATTPGTLDRWFSPNALIDADHAGVAYARKCLLQDNAEIIADYWDAIASHDVRDRLSAIRIPVTVIGATNDASFPLDAVSSIARQIPGSKFVEMSGPHMLPLENPSEFINVVAGHIASVEDND